MQIVGCGNRERADDAAGVLVVERLKALGVDALGARTYACTGEATTVMDSWSVDDDLIIIDVVVTGAPVGTVHLWHELPAVDSKAWVSTHGLGLAEAIKLARALDRFPKTLRVYGIEGRRFDAGSPVSPEVKEAAENLARQICAETQARNPR